MTALEEYTEMMFTMRIAISRRMRVMRPKREPAPPQTMAPAYSCAVKSKYRDLFMAAGRGGARRGPVARGGSGSAGAAHQTFKLI